MSVLLRLRNIFFYTLSIITLLLLILWGASFVVLPWQTNKQLEPLGLKLDETTNLSFNPFTLQVQIHDLALLDQQKKTQLSLKYAELDLSWLAFFSKVLLIEKAEISTLHLNAQRDETQLVIAGVNLSDRPKTATAPQTQTSNDSDPTALITGWQFNLPALAIDDVVLSINDMGHPHRIALNNLSLNNVNATLTNVNANLSLNASLNDAALSLDSKVEASLASLKLASATLDNQLEISQFALQEWQYLMPLADNQINELAMLVDLTVNQHITLDKQQWRINQPKLRLALHDIKLTQPELALTNQTITFELNQLSIDGIDQTLNNATGVATLAVDNLDVTTQGKTLASLARFEIPTATFDVDSQFNAKAHINRIVLADTLFSQPSADTDAVYQNDALIINDISWQDNHLAIDTIALDKFSSNVILTAQKELENLVLPKQNNETTSDEAVSEPAAEIEVAQIESPQADSTTAQQPAITFSLNKLELLKPSQIKFKDQSVNPVFEQLITLKTMQIETVDNRDIASMIPFNAALAFDDHALTTVKGEIAPFADKMNMSLDLTMSEFSLPPLSAYLRTVLGFDFLSGQLDNKVTLIVKDNQLDGETTIDLRGFELVSGNDTTELSATDGGAFGLNSALSMLKDDQGNVSLNVPLSGDINDPSFGVSSVVTLVAQKAIMSQAKTYLINTFVPYANIITVASIAGEYLLRLEMNDLVYDAGQVAVSEAQQPFVTQLGALLTDKPEQQVKMCPVASMQEVTAPQQALSKAEQINALKALSKQRGDTLKKVLIEQYNIESARLLLCVAKVDSDAKAQPRVEFSF
ncbi:DUF748 domain-containing protein [Psychrobium sp. 1_MG-2023]|uniref:DUF748 domain-containing protein n=1 Tax=Psychrobium sp. 1_MG-2023 TaxID=3062624 RepID=UPI0027335361|nr:DUF748 domain-containing protein [Psychrobium sp. 1_MG-2023]MDP2561377.1 DUF748 domain-containing protein [Psychrobium sp. 1_MG-2023]